MNQKNCSFKQKLFYILNARQIHLKFMRHKTENKQSEKTYLFTLFLSIYLLADTNVR